MILDRWVGFPAATARFLKSVCSLCSVILCEWSDAGLDANSCSSISVAGERGKLELRFVCLLLADTGFQGR